MGPNMIEEGGEINISENNDFSLDLDKSSFCYKQDKQRNFELLWDPLGHSLESLQKIYVRYN